MKTRNTLIGLGIAAALATAIGAYSVTASAQDAGYGWGMMGYGRAQPGLRPRLWAHARLCIRRRPKLWPGLPHARLRPRNDGRLRVRLWVRPRNDGGLWVRLWVRPRHDGGIRPRNDGLVTKASRTNSVPRFIVSRQCTFHDPSCKRARVGPAHGRFDQHQGDYDAYTNIDRCWIWGGARCCGGVGLPVDGVGEMGLGHDGRLWPWLWAHGRHGPGMMSGYGPGMMGGYGHMGGWGRGDGPGAGNGTARLSPEATGLATTRLRPPR